VKKSILQIIIILVTLCSMQGFAQKGSGTASESRDLTGSPYYHYTPDGKAFFESEKDNKNLNVKRSKLTNLVLASGARAENFCGIYEDSDVFDRILSGPKQQGLELKIINPFK
jgi:hypothetical protein